MQMTDQPTVDSELADDFDHLSSIVEQVGRLKLFTKVCPTVTGFLNTFTAVRQGYADGEEITIDEVRFWELATLCEDAFLNALPEGSGNPEDLRSKATRDAEDTEIPELLGVMRPFALVDLTLEALTKPLFFNSYTTAAS
jgi:hypothetical protein